MIDSEDTIINSLVRDPLFLVSEEGIAYKNKRRDRRINSHERHT